MNVGVVWDIEPPLSVDGYGTWDGFCHLWDDCILIIGGAGAAPEEAWDAYRKLSRKKKKKVIRVIVTLKGEEFEESKEVEDYNITVDDIKLLLEEYKKYQEEIKITVSNIKME
jgi:hypothetical protein